MAKYILEMFGISLGLTLLIELPIGFAMGMRGKKHILLMVLINVLTNPAAVLACWLGAAQIPVEIAVFGVEAGIFYWFSKDDKWQIKHPVLLALLANLISWASGILIQLGGRI